VRNLKALDDELLKLKLRKEIIRNEFSLSFNSLKDRFLSGRGLLSSFFSLFGGGRQVDELPKDKLDMASKYANWISNILELVNNLRHSR
jgi:hypothetical protein